MTMARVSRTQKMPARGNSIAPSKTVETDSHSQLQQAEAQELAQAEEKRRKANKPVPERAGKVGESE